MQVDSKTILLTGAAAGLGRALAAQFDQAGARLLLIDRDTAGLHALQKELNGPSHSFPCDLSQPQARADLLTDLQYLAMRIDLIVHCAGIGSHSPLAKLTPDEVQRVMQVNAVAPLELTAGLLMLLAKDGGIVMIGSVAGELTTPSMSLYSASKAAIHAFSRATAMERSASGGFSLLVILGALKNTRFNESIRHRARNQPGWYRRLDAEPTSVASAIMKAIQQERATLVYPGWFRIVLSINRIFAPLTGLISRMAYRKLANTPR